MARCVILRVELTAGMCKIGNMTENLVSLVSLMNDLLAKESGKLIYVKELYLIDDLTHRGPACYGILAYFQ